VESAHCKLCAWLSDCLRGNDADRLSQINELACCQVNAITLLANAASHPAVNRRADDRFLGGTFLYSTGVVAAYEMIAFENNFAIGKHVFGKNAASDPVGE